MEVQCTGTAHMCVPLPHDGSSAAQYSALTQLVSLWHVRCGVVRLPTARRHAQACHGPALGTAAGQVLQRLRQLLCTVLQAAQHLEWVALGGGGAAGGGA
jgi:hypothetical protein